MKTVVITGSARGFGFEMLKLFRKNNFNVVICDILSSALENANNELEKVKSQGEILSIEADITKEVDVNNLINSTLDKFKTIDIWINNAGVNQPNMPIWELDRKVIDRLIDIDLKGTILCSKLVMPVMINKSVDKFLMWKVMEVMMLKF